MTPLQNLPKNVGDLGIFIVAKGFKNLPKGFKNLPKVQESTQSGHTVDSGPGGYYFCVGQGEMTIRNNFAQAGK